MKISTKTIQTFFLIVVIFSLLSIFGFNFGFFTISYSNWIFDIDLSDNVVNFHDDLTLIHESTFMRDVSENVIMDVYLYVDDVLIDSYQAHIKGTMRQVHELTLPTADAGKHNVKVFIGASSPQDTDQKNVRKPCPSRDYMIFAPDYEAEYWLQTFSCEQMDIAYDYCNEAMPQDEPIPSKCFESQDPTTFNYYYQTILETSYYVLDIGEYEPPEGVEPEKEPITFPIKEYLPYILTVSLIILLYLWYKRRK